VSVWWHFDDGTIGGGPPTFCVQWASIVVIDAPVRHWPIIGRPIIGAQQSADYQLIQKITKT